LRAWERLGFTRLEGVDIAPSLLDHYQGIAKLYIADCRQLPLPDQSRDIVSVNGGLHHLPNLPEDLDQTLSEVRRTLRPTGLFLMVEPWMSPFLRILHLLSNIDLLRWAWPKVDAFATMNHYEWETYDAWMKQNVSTKKLLQKHFQPLYTWERWGKYYFVGQPRT
jgi:ubiquinone/menaquinone biosynthesis C-methylase UbiE